MKPSKPLQLTDKGFYKIKTSTGEFDAFIASDKKNDKYEIIRAENFHVVDSSRSQEELKRYLTSWEKRTGFSSPVLNSGKVEFPGKTIYCHDCKKEYKLDFLDFSKIEFCDECGAEFTFSNSGGIEETLAPSKPQPQASPQPYSPQDVLKDLPQPKTKLKPRRQVEADVVAGGPIERSEPDVPKRPLPPRRKGLEERIAAQERDQLGSRMQDLKDSDSLRVHMQNLEREIGQYYAQFQEHVETQRVTNGSQYTEIALIKDDIKSLKRTNSLAAAISRVYHAFVGKLKGKPKAPESLPPVIAPAPPKTAAPVIIVSMRTIDDGTKIYEFKTNDGLRAKIYEKGEKGYYSAMEYFTPAGQRSLYLLAPDKILNPVDKTPITPPSAVSDFYKVWKEQASIAKSLK